MAQEYELTSKIGCYLDRHLVFPLLEFLQVKQVYPEEEILEAKIQLLQKTNMVDFAMDIYKSLHKTEEVPQDMLARRAEVLRKFKTVNDAAGPVVQFISNSNLVKQLRQDKQQNQLFLQEHKIGLEQVEALYSMAKFNFDCGNYSAAAEFMYHYRMLSLNNEKGYSALWGKFAADILMQDWETALEDMGKLREIIDAKNIFTPLNQLQQRIWLMHWALFVFFNHENGRNAIIDLFFNERYLNAIQTNAHHLLRYLAAAVIVNKRRRGVLKELVKVIQQEAYTYSDPVTQFLECLFVRYDFDGAQVKLAECEAVLQADFFLSGIWEEFVENARLFIFETYCRIHQCIDIQMLAQKLHMDQEAAELWIVKLIRSAKLQAKIDSRAGTVIMGTQHLGIYEQLIEKTRSLTYRTYEIANQVQKQAIFVPMGN